MARVAQQGTPAAEPDPRDDEVLALRAKGRGFGTIARKLGMDRSLDANRAFNRALRRRPLDEQDQIRSAENDRLDRLAVATRANAELTPEETEKRLHTIDVLRTRLMAK